MLIRKNYCGTSKIMINQMLKNNIIKSVTSHSDNEKIFHLKYILISWNITVNN